MVDLKIHWHSGNDSSTTHPRSNVGLGKKLGQELQIPVGVPDPEGSESPEKVLPATGIDQRTSVAHPRFEACPWRGRWVQELGGEGGQLREVVTDGFVGQSVLFLQSVDDSGHEGVCTLKVLCEEQ